VRQTLAGPFLVGALLATPALGADDGLKLSGTAEFIASYLHLNAIDDAADSPVIQPEEAKSLWTLGGRGALDAARGSLHLQTDFSGEGTVHNRHSDDTYLGSLGGGLHAGWRDPELGSLGAFGSMGQFEINDLDGKDPTSFAWGVGLEGQIFFDPVTLYLQSGYLDREPVSSGGDKDALKNAGFARAVGRFFIGDDFEIEAEGSYAQGKMDPDGDNVLIPGWGVELDYRLPGTPIAGFLRYTGAYYFQDDDTDKMLENRIGFGLRAYFGQPSLKANDRRGASLDLPRYLQWNGVIAGPLE
jgi:hypothetical protein